MIHNKVLRTIETRKRVKFAGKIWYAWPTSFDQHGVAYYGEQNRRVIGL